MKRLLISMLFLPSALRLFAQIDTTDIAIFRRDTTTSTTTSQYADAASSLQDTTAYHDFLNDTIAEAVHIEDYIKRRGTMMTVAVKNNPEAKDKNTLQFLSTLPGVDGIRIYGRTETAKVYVNGREMTMPGGVEEYLKSLKAEDIRQIQILPTHGAKYSADTKGGIIRIQLRSREVDQISGNADLTAQVKTHNGSISLMPSVNLNYLGRKLSSYTYVSGYWLQDEQTASQKIIGEGEDQTTESGASDRGFYSLTADQSLLWTLSNRHEIGFAVEGFAKPCEWSTDNVLTSGSRIYQNVALYYATATLNYNWNYDDNGSNLKFGADFRYTNNTFNQDYYTTDTEEDTELDDSADTSAPYEHSDSKTNKYTWSLTADGDHFFSDNKSDLSYGVFYLEMNAQDKYNQYNTYDVYDFKERMYGVYAEFTTLFLDNKLHLDLGLRYEGYRSSWTYQDPYIVNENFERTNGSNSFNSLFPSASLSYRSPNGKSYTSLEYGRNIDRPGMYNYEPSVFRSGDNVFFANPTTLLPELENSFSLTETIGNEHTLRLSYSWVRNIYDYTYKQIGDQIYESRDNVGSSREVSLYFSTRFWIMKDWLRLSLSGSGDYKRYVNTTSGDFGTWGGKVNAIAALNLPKSWVIQVQGNYTTPFKYPTYWMSGFRGMNVYVRKTFNNGIVLGLTALNIVSNFTRKTYARVADLNYTTFDTNYFRAIFLYMTYRFGSSKVSVKQVRGNFKVGSRSSVK